MNLTDRLWASIASIFDSILAHPFIKGLTDGNLDRESFKFYVIQDALYLREFARALSIAAAKSPDDDWIITFNEHSATALRVERSLHESFFRDFNLSEEDLRLTEMAPTNLAYTSYLLAVAYSRPFHEVVASLLPCYWIYWEVGRSLQSSGSPDELYKRWIDTYASESFAEVVRAVLGLADKIGEKLNAEEIKAVERHFLTTSRYEWMFWDMGYRREQWPV